MESEPCQGANAGSGSTSRSLPAAFAGGRPARLTRRREQRIGTPMTASSSRATAYTPSFANPNTPTAFRHSWPEVPESLMILDNPHAFALARRLQRLRKSPANRRFSSRTPRGERLFCKQEVTGSIPVGSTRRECLHPVSVLLVRLARTAQRQSLRDPSRRARRRVGTSPRARKVQVLSPTVNGRTGLARSGRSSSRRARRAVKRSADVMGRP